jgi:hypothetical protein
MSLKALSRVWEESKQQGGTLLVQLAIADFADDTGGSAWPSIATLAKKSRMSDRNVQFSLARLVKAGELEIREAAGPHGVSVYQLLFLDETGRRRPSRGRVKSLRGEKISGVKNDAAGGEKIALQGVKSGGENCDTDGVKSGAQKFHPIRDYGSGITGSVSTDPSRDPSERENGARARARGPSLEKIDDGGTRGDDALPRGDPGGGVDRSGMYFSPEHEARFQAWRAARQAAAQQGGDHA